MNEILGIDLGTSSVKALIVRDGEIIAKAKAGYDEISPEGWYAALCRALRTLDLSRIAAVGLSSQVGTYIIDGRDVIGWNAPIGREELCELTARYTKADFIREIAMPHPQIISYPLPRLLHITRHYGARAVCQPKDFLCQKLTGRLVSDPWSWRGLYHPARGMSDFFLRELGITAALPPILPPDAIAGEIHAPETGIPDGTPLHIGMNDYYCSLLGMGVTEGDLFDITGTSEHLGSIGPQLYPDTPMVSGPYLHGFVHYGVTASGGPSMDFGMENFGFTDVDIRRSLDRRAPIFLPYLGGERAPIFDSDARGSFFGISAGCDRRDLAYAVLEGNVFSLYSIYQALGEPACRRMLVSGGAAKDPVLGQLKADLFGCPVHALREGDTSALGAAILAGAERPQGDIVCYPPGGLRERLLPRYTIYASLYPALKTKFKQWKETIK